MSRRVSDSESGPYAATAILRGGQPQADGDPAELRRERDEQAEHLEIGLVDDRDVDRIRDDAAVERGDDLLGDHACPILRLAGGRRKVRRDDDLVELEQGPV